MGITSFQRARRLSAEANGPEAGETSYDDATNAYLGVKQDAAEATKVKNKAQADLTHDTDLRRPASVGEGEGDNNKSLSPQEEMDWRGLTYSAGQPGDNQKNLPENLESLKTKAPLKTVDETQALLEKKGSQAKEESEDESEDDKSSSTKSKRTRKEG